MRNKVILRCLVQIKSDIPSWIFPKQNHDLLTPTHILIVYTKPQILCMHTKLSFSYKSF